MKRTLFSVLFTLFAVAIFSQDAEWTSSVMGPHMKAEVYFPGWHGYNASENIQWPPVGDTIPAEWLKRAAPKDPTVLVSYTIKRNWGGYITGAVAFQTNCFQVATDQNPIPPSCLLDRLVSELTARNLLKGANLAKPYRDYVEVTGWLVLNRDIVLSTKDSRWNAPVKE